ncbi:MAG: hypothetical protein ABIC91_02925 [Nanoarchaeota archaeon]|nr:hypothetical protein [Nanoarchaeota archaeon]MBU1030543.1 hypothetical protein [Nanoarchaeota archaeon]MBU1850550.1 hypothetical protein [Nanoarchaeota archaeon]
MKSRKTFFLTTLIMVILLIGACDTTRPNTQTENFYQGSEGIRMLVEPDAPPPRLYYYSDSLTDDYNDFSVEVMLENKGASYTQGGIYVSGYDPNLIEFEEVLISPTGGSWFDNCAMDFNFRDLSSLRNAFATVAGFFSCDIGGGGVGVSGAPGSRQAIDRVEINNLFQIFGWENLPDIDLMWDRDGQGGLSLDFSKFNMDISAFYHGKALLMTMAGLNFSNQGIEFMLRPDNYEYPGGEMDYITFHGKIKDTWPNGLDETDVTFQVQACYLYATYATPVICIDPNPYDESKKVCIPGQIDMKGSQGAPVAITSIQQESTPKKIIFTININNVGKGEIIHPGYLERCNPYYQGRLSPEHKDVIILADVRLAGSMQRLDCTQDNIIKLRDGRGKIVCTYELEYATVKSAYTAPLFIELWYGYSENQRRFVHIKRVS